MIGEYELDPRVLEIRAQFQEKGYRRVFAEDDGSWTASFWLGVTSPGLGLTQAAARVSAAAPAAAAEAAWDAHQAR
jgi:hypothetical protein